MIRSIVRLLGPLLDDNPFAVSRPLPRIYVILPIATSWQAALAVVKHPSSYIAWEGDSVSVLKDLQQVTSFLRGRVEGNGRTGRSGRFRMPAL
jgi:hypothetical protein